MTNKRFPRTGGACCATRRDRAEIAGWAAVVAPAVALFVWALADVAAGRLQGPPGLGWMLGALCGLAAVWVAAGSVYVGRAHDRPGAGARR